MPGNAFIRFKKGSEFAQGESLQVGYDGKEGWIELGDWSWDVEAEASHLKGTGAAVGKPNPGSFSITHNYDKSSPTLMLFIVKGTTFDTMQIDMLKQTGKSKPELFLQIVANNVYITKVSSKGGEDGNVTQDVEFVFKEIGFAYKPQKNDGSLDSAKFFRWSIAEMVQDTKNINFTIK